MLPGTKMPLQRIPNPADLAALIDYLREITVPAAK
jgi:cytochrome c2